MVTLLRIYLYWSVLWGFMVHPALGLKSLAQPMLLGMDLLVMSISATYIAIHLFDTKRDVLQTQARWASLACVLLLAYGLTVTALLGNSVIEAAKYLGALVRPMLVLIALGIHVLRAPSTDANSLFALLRNDIIFVMSAQLAVATLQKFIPQVGADFISSLSEQQSAVYALAEGHVSGTFANSIDLAYFLVAAYIVLTQQHWQSRLAPPVLLTVVCVLFTVATGSLTSQICLGVYIVYLWLRSLSENSRQTALICGSAIAGVVLYNELSIVAPIILDKVDDMMLSRLGLVFVSIPGLASSMPQRLLTGSGADFDAILTLLNNLPDVPLVFTYEDATSVINDVFWVALVLSIGLPAAVLFIYRMARLFQAYVGAALGADATQNLVRAIWLVVILAGLLNQILLVRPFTLTLTLGLLPLAMANRAPRRNTSA